MSGIRVLIADDHAMVRAGLASVLRAAPDIDVVAECADGPDAVDRATQVRPDVAVVDFAMPGWNGAEVAARLRKENSDVRLLVVSGYDERTYVRQSLQVGARGFVPKRAAADELVRAVRTLAGGGVYLDSGLLGPVVDTAPGADTAAGEGCAERLSDRESEVIRLIARGYCSKEVAARLDISIKTVDTYKSRAMDKLGLHGRVDLVKYAHARGWLNEA